MQAKPKVYVRLVDEVLSMPKREPRTIPPEDIPRKPIAKLREFLHKDAKRVVEDAYSVVASAVFGSTVLEERVPLSKLHTRMAHHTVALYAQAINKGALPLALHVHDRFQAFLDFGHGRVLRLHVQLHVVPKQLTTASYIVEHTDSMPEDIELPNELQYEQVASIPWTPQDSAQADKPANGDGRSQN